MCGIVGLFLKNEALHGKLGHYLADMLLEMTERGPDSAGFAVYHDPVSSDYIKCTVLDSASGGDQAIDWTHVEREFLSTFGANVSFKIKDSHALISLQANRDIVEDWFQNNYPQCIINSSGNLIEIYKEKGLPVDVIERFQLRQNTGTHALGHTRMATESAVTTAHSHPFSTGNDICLVHNGSLSNHNIWRRKLLEYDIPIVTDNDSEVASAYFNWRLQKGDSLNEAMMRAQDDLDGFYTFAIGTRDGFAVMRDPIGCKPAILAENDDWVAMSSEFRAISTLPGYENATIWEPEPGLIYSWSMENSK